MELSKDNIQDSAQLQVNEKEAPSTEDIKQDDEEDSLISDSITGEPAEKSELKHSDSLPDLIWTDNKDKKDGPTHDSQLPSSTSHDTGFSTDSAASTPSPDEVKHLANGVADVCSEETEHLNGAPDKEDEVMDILGNGLLKKTVLIPGKGRDSRPINGDTVTIKVDGILENGIHVDTQDLTFILNDGDVILAFDLAVALMEDGEKCELYTDARYAYGSLGREPDVPKDASITYTIDLIDIKHVQDLNTLNAETRLEMGEAKRVRGNYLYARQDYTGAINSYSKAVKMLDDPTLNASLDESSKKSLSSSWVKCYNNMAACQLKIEALDAAIRSCEKVLLEESDNVKALFRLGKAYSAKNEVDTALAFLRKAIKLDPESKMLHQEVLNLARRKSKESETEKELYQRMLGVKPGDSIKKKQDASNKVKKWVLMAGGAAAVMASIGLAWYRTG